MTVALRRGFWTVAVNMLWVECRGRSVAMHPQAGSVLVPRCPAAYLTRT